MLNLLIENIHNFDFYFFTIIFSPVVCILVLSSLNEKRYVVSFTLLSITVQTIVEIFYFIFEHQKSNESFYPFYKLINLNFLNYDLFFVVDSISMLLITLTSFLMLVSLIMSINVNDFKITAICFFFMEFFLFMAWTIQDLFIFYLCFESVLIPMFIIMNYWGGRPRKTRAALMLLLYTILGSIWMLLAIFWIFNKTGTVNILILQNLNMDTAFGDQKWLWLAFFLAFAVKIPIMPFHAWLPEAHVEAPTGGSVFLAGILLKLGCFGLLKILIPIFPQSSVYFTTFVTPLCICSIIYASFSAIRQDDLKRVIAYASIAHMNLIVLAIFGFNFYGIQGSIFQMISHGIVSGLLFACIGVLYDRFETRIISDYSGIINIMPSFCFVFRIALLANMAFPITSSFIGEFLILASIFKQNIFLGILTSISSILLGGIYSIWLLNRICYGNLFTDKVEDLDSTFSRKFIKAKDLSLTEKLCFFSLLLLILILGAYPNLIFFANHKDILFLLSLL